MTLVNPFPFLTRSVLVLKKSRLDPMDDSLQFPRPVSLSETRCSRGVWDAVKRPAMGHPKHWPGWACAPHALAGTSKNLHTSVGWVQLPA